ncbi:hypothetical protein SAMN05421877_101149 [Sphingobacterium lactis]|uniref:Uncharacterized protein n=1 Tax=Sphingobacterium lactis TaxID=797291 RepID=A0A1H5S3I5_9SPHI|nr:hypothetical protein SAMN05421877_101149 [Sphingobacterium lactis]
MERESTELNVQATAQVGVWKFILGFFVFLYKTAIRP